MPEGVGYGPQNTASIGKTLNYLGDRCYAYSGEIDANDNETTLLEFTTPKGIIKALFQFNGANVDAQECRYRIYFNGLRIQSYAAGNNAPDYRGKPDNVIPLLIPPLTLVKCTAQNITDSVSLPDQMVSLTGKIYK